jgi:hypothetical protein
MINFPIFIIGISSAYSFWAAIVHRNWNYIAFGVFSLFIVTALRLKKPWSKYFVYIWGGISIFSWILAVITIAKNGWPYSSILESSISLAPGFLFVCVIVVTCIVATKAFNRKR